MASTDDVLTALQAIVGGLSEMVSAQSRLVPSTSSGRLAATKVIQTGFVRVTGIDVVVAGAAGALHDVAATADVAASNKIHVVPATLGYAAVNLVFLRGLVYVPGAAQEAAIMYGRE